MSHFTNHTPKIDHAGRPIRRTYRTVGVAVASPISRRTPEPAPVPLGIRPYSQRLDELTEARAITPLPKYHIYE